MSDDDCDIFSMPTKRATGKQKHFTNIKQKSNKLTYRNAKEVDYAGCGAKANRLRFYRNQC